MRYAVLVILAAALAGTAAGAAQLGQARIVARIVTGNGPCSENAGFGSLWVSKSATTPSRESIRRRTRSPPRSRSTPARAGWPPAPARSGSTPTTPATSTGSTRPRWRLCEDPRRAAALGSRLRRRVGVGDEHAEGNSRADRPGDEQGIARIKAGISPQQVRYGAGAIWVGNGKGKNIWRIDPATNKAKAIPIGLIGPTRSPSPTRRSGSLPTPATSSSGSTRAR